MLRDKLFEYSNDFDVDLPQKLANIWEKFDVEKLLKPTNYDELKECFLSSGGFFNPEFTYDKESITKCCEDLKIVAQGLSNILVNIEPFEDNDDPTRMEFVRHLITARANEAISMRLFLEEVLKGCPEKAFMEIKRIYDLPDREIVRFAKGIAISGWSDIYEDFGEYTALSQKKRKLIAKTEYSSWTVVQSFRTALYHLLKEPIMCRYFNIAGSLESKTGDYEEVATIFEDGRLVIGVPENYSANGEELLALVGREVEGYFRTMAVTQTVLTIMLGKKSPLLPLVSVLAKSFNETNYHGLAISSYVYVKGLEGLPEPFSTLAIDYAKRKHNFAETAEYIYRYCLKFGLGEAQAREETWNAVAKAFQGQSNTRKFAGYAFLKNSDKLIGFLSTGNMTEDEYFYLRNLAGLESSEMQYACIGGWLDDYDFADQIDCSVDVIDYMSDFF